MGSVNPNNFELPPLPENEKTYAGIPEAVFVVGDKCNKYIKKKCVQSYEVNV